MTSTASVTTPIYERVFQQWEPLTHPSPQLMSQARIQLHWALQLVAAVYGAEDDALFDYDEERHMFLAPQRTFGRLGVRPGDLHLVWLGSEGDLRGELDLVGCSLDDAMNWLRGRLGDDQVWEEPLDRRPEVLRKHPLATGGQFDLLQPPDHRELQRWYDNAAALLRAIAEHRHADVRAQVHERHAQLSLRIDIDEERHVVVGMSPGDAGIPEPYFFVVPDPEPVAFDVLDNGSGGAWRTEEGWVGAILPASRLAQPAGDSQAKQVVAFTESAVEGCMALLGEPVSPAPQSPL